VRILVAVKQTAPLKGEYRHEDGRTPGPEDLALELNEWDAFALEAALGLVEATGAGEVIVASVGEERVEMALRRCLAMGADRAIRVWAAELQDADPLAVANVLASVARNVVPDLILCGAQSSDAANGATGVALAGLLDLPRVAVVRAIESECEGERLLVQRELDGGAVEVLRVSLPALLTIQAAGREPRHATLREIKRAREKPLVALGLPELGLESAELRAAAGSRTLRLLELPRGERANMIEGSPSVIAQRIAEIVVGAMRA
jgi:electron transfer flavoprotein beta subunit